MLLAMPKGPAQGWQTMTLRKGEISTTRLRREWPHHVALSADKVQGDENFDLVHGFADTLSSAAPRTFSMFRQDRDYVVFCFAKPEDAQTFCDRFGGERLTEVQKAR
jgi:hypothetical protein